MRLLMLFLLVVLATACGGKNSNTTIKVTTSALFAGSAALQGISEGGLMLWGVSDNGNRFGQTLEDTDSVDLDLPNGTWTFYAVAWDNATNDPLLASTGMKCAESTPTQLAGTQVNVALAVSVGTCANDIFRGYASSANSGTINAQLCENLTGVTAYNHVCSDDRVTAGANWKSDKVPMMSVKVTLPNYSNNTDVPGGISRCMVMPSNQDGSWTNATSMRLPIGDVANPAKSPFRLRLEFFPGNNACDNTGTVRGSVTRILPNGLLSPISPIKTFHNSGQHYTFLSLSDGEICNGRNGTYADGTGARFYAGGDGTTGHPHLICSMAQLYKIHDHFAAANFDKSFKLLTDVDLTPVNINGSYSSILPASSDCWDDGGNWNPIATNFDNPATPDCDVTTPYSFLGNFDGNGHTIKGLRMRFTNLPKIGFIGNWNVNGDYVRDLNFENVEVAGNNSIGAVVGSVVSGGGYGTISGVSVKGLNAEARNRTSDNFIGGIAGNGANLNLENINVQGRVRGERSYVGGVFGKINNSQKIKNVFSRVNVLSEESAALYIGGIGGDLASSNFVSNGLGTLSHEGVIVADGSKIGGLFGQFGTSNMPMNDFYATSAIFARDTANSNDVGGIVGSNSHAGSYNNGYFAGHVQDSCTSSCSRGLFYGSGSAPGGVGNFYYLSDNQPSTLGTGANGSANAVTNDVTTGTTLFTTPTGALTTAPWIHVSGGLPRFVEQQHPCALSQNLATVSAQLSAGRGTIAANPIILCGWNQLATIGSLAATKYVKLATNINVSASGFTPPNIGTGVTLNGDGNTIFGYIKSGSVGTANWAVFNEIAGTFKNTNLANIILQMSTATGTSSVSGITKKVFASGLIEDVNVLSAELSHADPADAIVSGITKENNGTIRRTSFDGNITADSYLAGFAYLNSSTGTIQESEAQGNLAAPAAGSYFYGFVGFNAGVVSRNSVHSKLYSASVLNHISQFVGINQGTISDVHVTNEALWSFSYGSNVAQLAVENDGSYSATITRALVEGEFLNTNLASSSVAVSATQQAKPVNTVNAGVHQGVLAVPAGRKILMNSAAACSSTSFSIPSGSISATAFNSASSYFVSSMEAASKIVWLRIESNGKTGFLQVTDASNDNTNLSLTLEATCTSLGFSGTVTYTVIQDYDTSSSAALGSLTTSPYNGFISGANYIDDTSFVGPWLANLSGAPVSNFVYADTTAGGPSTHLDWIFDVYEGWLTQTAAPTAPIWELSDDDMELFNMRK